MKYNRFNIVKIILVLLLTCITVFAAETPAKTAAPAKAAVAAPAKVAPPAPAKPKGPVLTELEKFYGTALKSAKKVVHPPYEWGDCTVCHTDAKGEEGLIMDPPELCAMCHEAKDTKKFIHGPVAAGACTACHNPHESDNAKLLVSSSINELCTSCHQAKDEFLARYCKYSSAGKRSVYKLS